MSEVPVIGVQVLGPLEVTVDGVPVGVGGPRQRCVLARLIAARGQVVSADRLIEDLYAGEAPPKALAAMQSYVSHLRRALEPDRAAWDRAGVLAACPPGYALRLGPGMVDAWVFEDQVHQAAGLADPAAAHARLSSALAYWRGEAFQEFAGLPWADLEASRLAELRLTAIEVRADAALQLGRAAQLVADLDQLTAQHPLREEAWRLLALALYQSGRQGDALAALRRARARLAEELGVDPGPALRQLEEGILAQAPQLSAPAASPPQARPQAVPAPVPMSPGPAPAPGEPTPLPAEPYLGRDAELAQALDAAADAASGRTRIVLVTGDAGAGKTALADRVSQRLAAGGWTVTTGRCPEHEGAPAGWAWAEALRRLIRAAPPAEPQALAALLTDTAKPESDAAAARFRLHRAVAAFLEVVSRAAPLLVVLDDLHRADSETLAILTSVSADLTGARILVLATYRPAEAGEQLGVCLAALAARGPVRVTLRGLDAAAAGELIRATCSDHVDEATTRVIADRTGGNPFFIKETARLLDSEGARAAATEVASGVREVLQRRIARLPATAQTVLRDAAVIGTETGVGVLGEVAGADENVLLDAIEAGLLTGLVTEPAAGRIRFAHALVRDTLYQSLSRLRRSRLHARAAEAIERHHPREVAALAYHLAEAGTDPLKAARYCGLAAGHAEQRFAYHEAARLWKQAIACLDQAGDPPARDWLELVLCLVGALAHTGQLADARSWRRDAIRAALPLREPALLAKVITAFDVPQLFQTHEYGVTDHELLETVEQTLAGLPPGDHPLRCRLLSTMAFELDGAESERGYQASAEAVEMARRLGDPGVLTMAINSRHRQSFRHDGLAERGSLGAELLALPGKPVTAEALAHVMLMRAGSGGADFAAADLHAAEAAHIADRYDFPVVAAQVGYYRAMRAMLAGNLAAAEDLYQQADAQIIALRMWRHGARLSRGVGNLGRFCVLLMRDRVAEIAGELERAFRDLGAPVLLSEPYALALAASGRIAEAREVADRPRPIPRDAFWLFLTGIRGLLAIAIDDRERGESAYQALLPYAGRPAGADLALFTLWPAAQILGDLARYLGMPGSQAHYQHALAIAELANVEPWREAAKRRLRARPAE
ncbi:MAG TPA: BTAD domain-containing putative transcriptional regulator [Streptosporangiaceae bacterium]|nr:BTAD domain-containing putative transcriptional regulator [Streptosporangiaceae bacterium]